jgi:hypothetical protein
MRDMVVLGELAGGRAVGGSALLDHREHVSCLEDEQFLTGESDQVALEWPEQDASAGLERRPKLLADVATDGEDGALARRFARGGWDPDATRSLLGHS